jgi:hypothetical protein
MTNFFASSTSRIRIKSIAALTLIAALFSLSLFAVASFERNASAAPRTSCRIPAKRAGAKSVLGRKRTVFVRKMVGTKFNRHSIVVKRVLCQPRVKRSGLVRRTTVVPTTVPQSLALQPLDTGVVVPLNTSLPVVPTANEPLAAPASADAIPVVEAGAVAVPVIVSPDTSSPGLPTATPASSTSTSTSTSAPANSLAPGDSANAGTTAEVLEAASRRVRRRRATTTTIAPATSVPTVTVTTVPTVSTVTPTTTVKTTSTTAAPTTAAPTTAAPTTAAPTTSTPPTTPPTAPPTTTVIIGPSTGRLLTSYAGGASVIGIPWAGDSRSRLQVTDHSDVDYVFTATETSSLVSITAEIVGNNPTYYAPCPATTDEDSCYSSGHGGTIRLDIYANDSSTNGPTGASLGSHTWNQPLNGSGYFSQAGNDQGSWQGPLALSPAPSVVAGNVYHAVWTNPHPAAASNWYGLNQLSVRGVADPLNGRAQQPVLSSQQNDARFRGRSNPRGLHQTGNVWRSCTANPRLGDGDDCWNSQGEHYSNVPVVQYKYGNGKESGNGYVLALLGNATPASPIYQGWAPLTNGTTKTRQVFKVTSAVTIDQIGARINPVVGGTARFNIRRKSDGALITSADLPFNVPGPLTPGYVTGITGSDNGVSVQASLTPTVLAPGLYYVEFERVGGAVYVPEVMRPLTELQGSVLPAWGPGTRWEDGELQKFNGTSWIDSNTEHTDAFVYLRVA